LSVEKVIFLPHIATRLSGGGWAKSKNGEAHFWARVGGAV